MRSMPEDVERKRARQRKWVVARRAAYLEGRCCADCDATSSLELHHLDPAQKVSHRIFSWSEARREIELAKCIVLCAPCHLARAPRQPCGTHAAYQRGCRCDPCREAKSVTRRTFTSR